MFKHYISVCSVVDVPFTIIVTVPVLRRLEKKRFRLCRPLAGNFSRWLNFREFFQNKELRIKLFIEINACLKEDMSDNSFGDWNVTIQDSKPVGWSECVQTNEVPENCDIRKFQLNKYTSAMKIINPEYFEAPLTREIGIDFKTVSYNREGTQKYSVLLYDLFPGKQPEKGSEQTPLHINPKNGIFLPRDIPGEPLFLKE